MINKPIWIVSCKARPLEGVPLNLIIQSFILLKALYLQTPAAKRKHL